MALGNPPIQPFGPLLTSWSRWRRQLVEPAGTLAHRCAASECSDHGLSQPCLACRRSQGAAAHRGRAHQTSSTQLLASGVRSLGQIVRVGSFDSLFGRSPLRRRCWNVGRGMTVDGTRPAVDSDKARSV